jgi:hypothetical protein
MREWASKAPRYRRWTGRPLRSNSEWTNKHPLEGRFPPNQVIYRQDGERQTSTHLRHSLGERRYPVGPG